jgi:hypothetical protein
VPSGGDFGSASGLDREHGTLNHDATEQSDGVQWIGSDILGSGERLLSDLPMAVEH